MRLALLIVAIVTLAGCSARTIVGKWVMPTQYGPLDIEFMPDKSFQAKGSYLSVQLNLNGTYELSGEKMTITPQKLDASDPSGVVPKELIERGKLLFGNEIMRARSGTVQWKNEDEVTLIESGGETLTLTRFKEPATN